MASLTSPPLYQLSYRRTKIFQENPILMSYVKDETDSRFEKTDEENEILLSTALPTELSTDVNLHTYEATDQAYEKP
ncbi:hypothetical protein OUZ56_020604 [Daphnia magna]|uniref:Uncharacterized protein n=1 Tax=Daphnia magna TaxID=35525 RepID=A0ABQ9ZG05_9CRUS|nr:hypothetical protein OUZ56_020604 [Daphnia magna]